MQIKRSTRYNRNKIYASAKEMPDVIYAGAYLDNYGYVCFNWKHDDYDKDIVALCTDTSGEFDLDGVRYVYGFQYIQGVSNQEKSSFRNYIKHLGTGYDYLDAGEDKDVIRFIDRGINNFDKRYPLNSFGATVHVEPTSKNTIVDHMAAYIADISDSSQISFKLIKQMYRYVKFDTEKAYQAMMDTHKYSSSTSRDLIKKAEDQFNALKKSGNLFEMKKFLPRPLRDGFEDYLKFPSAEAKSVYESLQGVNVLIYDDFMTSGATVKEVVRYLRSINNQNTLTVFVLIKQ